MTELKKLEAGLEYCFLDQGVADRKERALRLCCEFNSIDPANHAAQIEVIYEKIKSILYGYAHNSRNKSAAEAGTSDEKKRL